MYDVTALRARIPALASGTAFFDGPGGTQTPAEVADAITAALQAPLANRGTVTEAARNAEAIVVEFRAAMADLLGAPAEGIVFGRSMTALTYELARTLAAGWGPGDELLVTRLDHDANVRPWVQAAARAGATVRRVDFDPIGGELTAADVAAVLTDRTRLVAVTGASNLIGTRPPVAEIAALAHAVGALVHCDVVHLAAHARVDLAGLGADLIACSPYKFLGPHCGVLAGAPALLATLHPDRLEPASDAVPERFEHGTLPYELLAGVTAAVDVLASLGDSDGDGGGGGGDGGDDDDGAAGGAPGDRRARLDAAFAAIEAHEGELALELERGLDALPGVTLHGRAPRRTPTLLATFSGVDAAAVASSLAARGVNAPAGSFYAIEASRRLGFGDAGGLRMGIAPYTSSEDVTRLLDGVAAALERSN